MSWVQEGLRELGYGPSPVNKSESSDIQPPTIGTYEGEDWQPKWSDVKERTQYKPEWLGTLLEYSMKLPCGKELIRSKLVEDIASIKKHKSLERFYIDDAKYAFAKEGGWKMSDWVD